MKMKLLAKLLAHRPKTVLLVFTIITALIGLQASNIYMESDFTSYLPEDDPTMSLWNRINHEFQIGYTIIILVDQTDRVYDIRDPKVLTEMDEIYLSIYEKPLIEGEDPGIISIRSLAALIKKENAKPPYKGGNGENKRKEKEKK